MSGYRLALLSFEFRRKCYETIVEHLMNRLNKYESNTFAQRKSVHEI